MNPSNKALSVLSSRWIQRLRFRHLMGKYFPPTNHLVALHFRDSLYAVLYNGVWRNAHLIILYSTQPILYPKIENEYYIYTHTRLGTPLIHAYDLYGICRTYQGAIHTLIPYTPSVNALPPCTMNSLYKVAAFSCPAPYDSALHPFYEAHVVTIQRRWRDCISNPNHPLCQKRLQRESNQLISEMELHRTTFHPISKSVRHCSTK